MKWENLRQVERILEPRHELGPVEQDTVTCTLFLAHLRLDADLSVGELVWRNSDSVRDVLLVDECELLGQFRFRFVHEFSLAGKRWNSEQSASLSNAWDHHAVPFD